MSTQVCSPSSCHHHSPVMPANRMKQGSENDSLEMEAEVMANRVMHMPDPNFAQRKIDPVPGVETVQKMTPFLQKQADTGGEPVPESLSAQINATRNGGRSLPGNSRTFMENSFGADFSSVRIHTGKEAEELSGKLNAQAFTVGNDIYFNRNKFAPDTSQGKHLLAHELTHTIQQSGSLNKKIQKLSAANCSSNCSAKDGNVPGDGKYKLIVMADKESDFFTIPMKKEGGQKSWPVGHSWVKLVDASGEYWTYGFWPKTGFDSSAPFKDVTGCVHHPDTAHTPSSSQEFELTADEFKEAKKAAKDICLRKPDYNLYSNQCTSFARDILAAAGKAPIGGFGLFWNTPNALSSWMNSSSLGFGLGYNLDTSTFSNQASGPYLYGSYTHQFYSLLGNKLRLLFLAQASVSFTTTRVNSLGAGLQLEYKPQQIVYLPSLYVFGTATGGLLSPGNETQKWGAGYSVGAGLNYNVQDILMVGVEYSAVKNLVISDPVLNSLAIKVGFVFQ